MKIIIIVGARPQFIKLAALHEAVKDFPQLIIKTIHTGQHYDPNMSGNFFKEMKIKAPDYNCNINNNDPGIVIDQMTNAIESILKTEKPDWAMVIGDTNSTLAGALAANNLNIKLAHVEAGLRSYNDTMPEEIIRVAVDKISDILFVPTQRALNNLEEEKKILKSNCIKLVGDLMLDTFNYFSNADNQIDFKNLPKQFILATLHREYILSNRNALANVILALNEINESIPVIFCAHPKTLKVLSNMAVISTFQILPPQNYLTMLSMLRTCRMVMTDSGGLQREAFFAKKPSLCIRTETEWQELETAGVTVVTGYDTMNILKSFENLSAAVLNFDGQYFGTGNAGRQIFEAIVSFES